MQEIRKKNRFMLKAVMLMFVFALLFVNTAYATSYEEANIVIGKNSTEGDEIYFDDRNSTFDKVLSLMSEEDAVKMYAYISEYRKGKKDMDDDLYNLIAKYDEANALHIVNYILNEKYTTYLTSFTINHTNGELTETPMRSVMSFNNEEMTRAAQSFWTNAKSFMPVMVSSKIHVIHFEKDKDEDNLITICESTALEGYWDMNVDIKIVDIANTEKLWDFLMYATVYWCVLNDMQVDNLITKKGNYVFNGNTYRDDSYINKFYKKFWKGRRQETNTDQYSLYKKEFLNRKASRTVYDDMAVSFVNYVRNGYMRRYLGFRAEKNNFFDDYEFFRLLAKHFRVLLNINVM